ncbi:hypothetical protein ABK045_20130 [Stenotrophomonas pavanii]|uniref:hypothetical protein n=1 Tax=Stenotrophomonas TaxID=40323 RepID=UPI0021C6C5E2|nr:hypothetical protein [Stenotrophomonas sp. Sm5341]MCU1123520.1 hypothetical protein [Stenotrophomonas maltophilia]MDQ7286974.1 hypothetical protein [Stenotrophomonas sp. Sm5341]
MSLVLSESGANAVELFATRIDVQWDFRTNTGPVLFHFERVDWDRETKMLNTRAFERTVRDDIAGLIGGEYTITDPVTGDTLVEPGWKLMAMIKAATERVWDAATALSPIVVPDELPVDEEG